MILNFSQKVFKLYNIIAQIFGILGASSLIFSFQQKKSKNFFLFQTLGSGLFLINYLMLGAYTGALISIMSVTRSALVPFVNRKSSYFIFPLLLIIPLIISFYIYTGIETILMMIAYLVFTIAMFTKNSKIIRITQFVCASPFQLIHNAMVSSVGGIICEAFNMISIIVSIKRLGLKNFEPSQKN